MEYSHIVETLESWNFWKRELEIGIPRSDYLPGLMGLIRTGKVISVIGVRRAGKSTLIRQAASALIGQGVPRDDILIVNFEEPQFEGADSGMLGEIYDAYREIIKPGGTPFLFLDEIQNVAGWERFVRSINEKKEANIVITGSSSKLLSEELASRLTGRQLYIEVYPFSFREFLSVKGIDTNVLKNIVLASKEVKNHFRDHMRSGGFPEVALNADPDFQRRVLKSYYDDIIGRDIVQRFRLRNADQLRSLARFYLTNISSQVSFNQISKALNIPTETIRRFTSYLETSDLIFFYKRFSWTVKEQENSPRKNYAIDTGLANAVGFRFSENLGKAIENIVAIELKRRQGINPGIEIYYWKDLRQKEVDFIIKDGVKIKELIQVCWDTSKSETREREVSALTRCMEELRINAGTVLTETFEGEEKIGKARINYKPVWKWLCGI